MMRATTLLALLLVTVITPGSASAAGPVPSSLTALESSAEDLVDVALAGNRQGVVTGATELSTLANGPAAASLSRAGVPHVLIGRLKQRAGVVRGLAARGAFVRVALAANAVSGLMAQLYGHFRDRVPPSVLALDYLDREAHLRSLVGERKGVANAVKHLEPTWTSLRRKVIASGGTKEAAAFDKHVAAMKRLVGGPLSGVRAEALHGLVLVDQLEGVFTR
jgi:hypothetical protein